MRASANLLRPRKALSSRARADHRRVVGSDRARPAVRSRGGVLSAGACGRDRFDPRRRPGSPQRFSGMVRGGDPRTDRDAHTGSDCRDGTVPGRARRILGIYHRGSEGRAGGRSDFGHDLAVGPRGQNLRRGAEDQSDGASDRRQSDHHRPDRQRRPATDTEPERAGQASRRSDADQSSAGGDAPIRPPPRRHHEPRRAR